jgi:NAD-dependent SIR2 family protein deacetylase
MYDSGSMLDELAAAMATAPRMLVVTGAGISAASGIPTFRTGADALWSREIMEKATLRYFSREPLDAWLWYLARLDSVHGAAPNRAHHALVELQHTCASAGRRALLVTQNVDGLHAEAAGGESDDLIEVHGALRYARCADPRCWSSRGGGLLSSAGIGLARLAERRTESALPRCEYCGELLRPHVLWFDESYDSHPAYGFAALDTFLPEARLLLFVGTSFSVGLTDFLVNGFAATAGIPAYSIDPSGDDGGGLLRVLREKAEDALPALLTRLSAALRQGSWR